MERESRTDLRQLDRSEMPVPVDIICKQISLWATISSIAQRFKIWIGVLNLFLGIISFLLCIVKSDDLSLLSQSGDASFILEIEPRFTHRSNEFFLLCQIFRVDTMVSGK